MIQVELFESHDYSILQKNINKFLQSIDEDDVKDIKLSTHSMVRGDNRHDSYSAIVIYKTAKSNMDYNTQPV
jgi:hypothetical protein